MSDNMNKKQAEESSVPKLKKSFLLKWSTTGIGMSASYILMGYLTLYATNIMGLGAGAVGIAIMLSKFCDGISDVIAGVVIDKTNTKMGKGRPYNLALIGYWLCIALLFSAPQMSRFAGIIYLFVLYTLTYSVFATLLYCSEPVYMANALDDTRQSISILSFGGVLSSVISLAFGILVPILISSFGNDAAGWSKISWMMAVPLTLVGLIRFFTIKEKRNTEVAAQQKISVRDMLRVLAENKYILILAILVFISYFGSNLSGAVGSYYAVYIFGDIGVASIMTLALLPLVIFMAFVPVLSRKFTLRKCIIATMILGIVGSLIRLINVYSIPLGFLGACLSGIAFPAFYGFASTMTLDCMDYGEWKSNTRVEGTLSSVQSLMNKIGTALGAGIAGILLDLAAFDGMAEAEPDSALHMIIALATVIPALFYVIFLVVYKFYDLDKKMPQIRSELKERKENK